MAQAKEEVNILAFGDSLTEGYCSPEFLIEFHPYTAHLKRLLDDKFSTRKDAVEFKVHNHGLSGECVHNAMMPRLKEILQSSSMSYDIAIINGGTNDLGMGSVGADVIAGDLIALHELLHARGIPTVVYTVPQAKFDKDFPSLVERRNALNEKLRHQATLWSDMAVVGGVNKRISYGAEDSNGKNLYDRDGLHFSAAGYKRVAEVIFESLRPLLMARFPRLSA